MSAHTVGKWRRRFLETGLDGLKDAPRSGTPRRIPDGDAEWVLVLTLLSDPAQGFLWTTRSMSQACGVSQSSVSRTWRGFALRPWDTRPAQARRAAQVRATFQELAALYVDPDARRQARLYRVSTESGLRDWLAAHEARTPVEPDAKLVLCNCTPETESLALEWQSRRPQVHLLVAPQTRLWTRTVVRWLAPEGRSSRRRALARIAQHVRHAVAQGEGGIHWTPGGQWLVDHAASGLASTNPSADF